MNTNQQLVTQFWQCFAATDLNGAAALLHEDANWCAMGEQGGLPLSGEMDVSGILSLMQSVRDLSEDGLALTMKEWTVQGERVAVEMEGYAKMTNGKVYHNKYHFLIVIRDGKICTLREYGDTDLVRRTFL
ncbi:nuclear transport factor 2 family protein [Ferrimonas lipolytica]|uniref:SnoaL-like domain-containing protein n=1 Tax=Ferrimonas lipolytica TaxID=2724191 RepID=A0A6H1U9S5_9GAMM|nr:nuclear transport factor 2 family protein [Ferrimonas lipolytica]QIZ75797.1 SnoaL-like domain-containing protein [Ferrimonas lipolytica]